MLGIKHNLQFMANDAIPPPTALIAVFAFSLGQIAAGVVLCRRHGWRGWWLMFLVGNVACVVGQGTAGQGGASGQGGADGAW